MTRRQRLWIMIKWGWALTLFQWAVKLTWNEATPTLQKAYADVTAEYLRWSEERKNWE